jgi:hypothetical protein
MHFQQDSDPQCPIPIETKDKDFQDIQDGDPSCTIPVDTIMKFEVQGPQSITEQTRSIHQLPLYDTPSQVLAPANRVLPFGSSKISQEQDMVRSAFKSLVSERRNSSKAWIKERSSSFGSDDLTEVHAASASASTWQEKEKRAVGRGDSDEWENQNSSARPPGCGSFFASSASFLSRATSVLSRSFRESR